MEPNIEQQNEKVESKKVKRREKVGRLRNCNCIWCRLVQYLHSESSRISVSDAIQVFDIENRRSNFGH